MSDKKNTTNLIILALFLLGLTSITIELWNINLVALKNVITGIGISLLSSAVIILVTDKLFNHDSSSLDNSEIIKLLNSIKSDRSIIKDSSDIGLEIDYKALMNTSENIYMLGYDLMEIFESYSSDLINALKRGAAIKILLVRYESTTKRIIQEHTNSADRFAQRFSDAKRKIKSIVKQCPGMKLEYFETTWPVSYKAIFFEGSHKNFAKIDLIPFSMKQTYEKHRVLLLNKSIHPNDFNYFKMSFEYIIQNDAENMTEKMHSLAFSNV